MGNSQSYLAENKEKIRAYMRAYYLAHNGADRQRIVPGAMRQSKRCKKCGIEKSRSEYTVYSCGSRAGHLAAYCKLCRSKIQSVTWKFRIANDQTLYRRVQWKSKLKRKYGISMEDYYRILDKQGGGCALCGSKTSKSRGYKRISDAAFCVDHCHSTGKIRGLLCTACNRAIGLIKDNHVTAKKMANYLRREVDSNREQSSINN